MEQKRRGPIAVENTGLCPSVYSGLYLSYSYRSYLHLRLRFTFRPPNSLLTPYGECVGRGGGASAEVVASVANGAEGQSRGSVIER